jgi:hypothetical protein
MERKKFKDENEFNAVVSAIRTQLLTLFDRVGLPKFGSDNGILSFYCEIDPLITGNPKNSEWVYMAHFFANEYIPFYHDRILEQKVIETMPDIHYQFKRCNPSLFAERGNSDLVN